MYSREERLKELAKSIQEGKKAEEVMEYAESFLEIEKRNAMDELLTSPKDPQSIRDNLRAANRFVAYLRGIVGMGILDSDKYERMKND